MGEKQQIIYMQTRIIRLASEEWKKSMEEISEIFTGYNVLQYIEQCFDMFHMEGDEAILADIEEYLKNKGMQNDTGTDR